MDDATRATAGRAAMGALDARFVALATTLTDVVSLHGPNGVCLFASDTAYQLIGVESVDLVGLDWGEFVPDEDDNPFAAAGAALVSHRLVGPAGPPLHAETTVIPVEEGGELTQLLCVTRAVEAGGWELHDTPRDRLTGLPAWDGLVERLGGLLTQDQIPTVALVIELDDMQSVEERLGSDAVDRVLDEAARRVQTMLRPTDLLGRLEGDRLCALCAGVMDQEVAVRIAERVRDVVARELPFEPVTVTASVGAALATPGADAETVLRLAVATARDVQVRGGNGVGLRGRAPDVLR
jgi:diguanylate cyclase (GGDEF)-like protein